MLHPSTKKLIDKLRDKTDAREIAWSEGEDGACVFDTEGYRVTLTPAPVEVILSSAAGKELERAEADTLAATPHDDAGTYAELAKSLQIEASRIARGAEEAIATVLAGLDGAIESAAASAADPGPSLGPADVEDAGDDTHVPAATEPEAPAPDAAAESEAAEPASTATLAPAAPSPSDGSPGEANDPAPSQSWSSAPAPAWYDSADAASDSEGPAQSQTARTETLAPDTADENRSDSDDAAQSQAPDPEPATDDAAPEPAEPERPAPTAAPQPARPSGAAFTFGSYGLSQPEPSPHAAPVEDAGDAATPSTLAEAGPADSEPAAMSDPGDAASSEPAEPPSSAPSEESAASSDDKNNAEPEPDKEDGSAAPAAKPPTRFNPWM